MASVDRNAGWQAGFGDQLLLGVGAVEVRAADLDGTGVDESFITDQPPEGGRGRREPQYPPGEVPTTGVGAIGRADLDGSNVDGGFIDDVAVDDVAVDVTHVYWTDHTNAAIGRANLDGTGVDQRFIARPGRTYPW